MQPALSVVDALPRACAPAREGLGRKVFGRERRRCLRRQRPASASTTTSTSALLFLAGSQALDNAPPLVQLAVDGECLETATSYLTDASSVERILSSAAATSSSDSFSSPTNFSSSVVGIFDTADLATTGDVLNFLLHHPLLTAAAASFAVFAVPRLVKAIAKNVVLPVAALGTLLVVLAAPEASLGLARGLFSFVTAHPVACSALILAAAGVALSPYLLLAAAVLALAWGVPRLPAPLRPQFLPAPIAAEARATLESAKEKLDSYFVDGGGGLGGETAKSAAAATAAAAKEAARELEKIKQAVELPARSTAAAVSRAAGRAKAATSAVKAAASAGAQAIGEVGRCRSEPTAAERAACVRQQEADLLDREGGKRGGEESGR